MKRASFIFTMLLLAIGKLTIAQSITATGNVKNDQGNPVHYVFVYDSQQKNGTYTDSLGNFSIAVNAGARLQFSKAEYRDTLVDVSKAAADLQVTLKPLGSGGQSANSLKIQTVLSSQPISASVTSGDIAGAAGGGTVSGLAHQKGQVHGNRYLFSDFVHGYVITQADALVQNPNYLFDYDKMGGGLYLTKDGNSVTEVTPDQIKSFTLFSPTDQLMTFEKAPAIDKAHYTQVLASGKKYKIYKTISTKFMKSDYVNSGITSHGNDYDEFVDEYAYYVMDAQSSQVQKISLKKKALKTAFAKDADKINKYLNDNSEDIDDAYLSKLGAYMNQ